MAETNKVNKKIALHPIREDGTLDLDTTLCPKTLDTAIINADGTDFHVASQEGLTAETTRAEQAENSLSSQIEQAMADVTELATDLYNKVNTEIDNRQDADAEIRAGLADEITRAKGEENTLDNKISVVDSKIRTEENRAKAAEKVISDKLSAHEENTLNPHEVTKAQVGLGNVDNKSEATIKSDFTGAIASGNTGFALGGDVYNHTSNTNNPHQVTKAQVGLGNVDNTSDANKPVSTATQAALNAKADASDLSAHTGNTNNPHNVTKAQVGLGNVANTGDSDTPISGGATKFTTGGAYALEQRVSDNYIPRSGNANKAAQGAIYSETNDVNFIGTKGKAGIRALIPNTQTNAGQVLLTSDSVSGSYMLAIQAYNKTKSDLTGSSVYNTLRLGEADGLKYRIGDDILFNVNTSGDANIKQNITAGGNITADSLDIAHNISVAGKINVNDNNKGLILPQVTTADETIATQSYVTTYGGKINTLSINGDTSKLPINNKNIDFAVDGTYNSSTNKLATQSTVSSAINALDIAELTNTANKTISSLTESNGIVNAAFQPIQITENQVTNLVSDLSSKVDKSQTIAGVDLQDNITKAELLQALNVENGAKANVKADWTAETGDAEILNKPETLLELGVKDIYDKTSTDNAIALALVQAQQYTDQAVATNSGNFMGTLDLVDDLQLQYGASIASITTALNNYTFSQDPGNNDTCFVADEDDLQNSIYHRFKFNTANNTWAFEYDINNSTFSQSDWDAIRSGITSAKVSSYDTHIANTNNPHGVTKAQIGLGNVNNTNITVTETSVSSNDGTTTTTFSKYSHPTTTATSAGLYRVGKDSLGHVVLGDSFTIPTKSSWNYDDIYVKYSASQSLTDTQKSTARSNIGAGTSSLTLGTTHTTAAYGDHNHDSNYVAKNVDIAGATKCKITYDSKGLVTGGADLVIKDIPDLSGVYLTVNTDQDINSNKSFKIGKQLAFKNDSGNAIIRSDNTTGDSNLTIDASSINIFGNILLGTSKKVNIPSTTKLISANSFSASSHGITLPDTTAWQDDKELATTADIQDYHDNTKQDTISDLATIRSGAAAGATAVQPAAIADMATKTWVGQQDYATNTALTSGLAAKQDTISDLSGIRAGAALGNTAVQPATLQTELDTKQDVISDLVTIRGGAALGATAVQPTSLATVATTGDYDDLTDKPDIPTKTSDLTNDGDGITQNDPYAKVSQLPAAVIANPSTSPTTELTSVTVDNATYSIGDSISYISDASSISGPNTSGRLIFVITNTEPSVKYDGYFYIITTVTNA